MREEFASTVGSRAENATTCSGREIGIDESVFEGGVVSEGMDRTLALRAVAMVSDWIAAAAVVESAPPLCTPINSPVFRFLVSPSAGGSLGIGLLLTARNSHDPPVRETVRNARAMTILRRIRALYCRRGPCGTIRAMLARSLSGNFAVQLEPLCCEMVFGRFSEIFRFLV
jgi:hypothetical protein